MIRESVIHSVRVRPGTVYVRIGKTEVEIPRGELQEWLNRVAAMGPEVMIALAVLDQQEAGVSLPQMASALNGKRVTVTVSVSA